MAFVPGHFLEALDQRRWLVIDEMNRSNFDRAFGQLFTVLSGQSVVLPYTDEASGKPLRLRLQQRPPDSLYKDIVVGDSWRVIATINNFDKSLLFEMSFALMRRFAFIEVPAPPVAVFEELIARQTLTDDLAVQQRVARILGALLPMRSIKDIGPAIFIDAAKMARNLVKDSALDDGRVCLVIFYALLLPQFEGIEEPVGQNLARLLRKAAGSKYASAATKMLRDVLGLDLGQASEQANAESDLGPDPFEDQ